MENAVMGEVSQMLLKLTQTQSKPTPAYRLWLLEERPKTSTTLEEGSGGFSGLVSSPSYWWEEGMLAGAEKYIAAGEGYEQASTSHGERGGTEAGWWLQTPMCWGQLHGTADKYGLNCIILA